MKINNPSLFLHIIGVLLMCLVHFLTIAQHHNISADYIRPSDSLVRQNLEEWQDLKFGLFVHWGIYSQWGIIESWNLCPEDRSWNIRRGAHAQNYFEYVKAYEKLQTTFNPIQFNPEKWAETAKRAGMKYVVFTTKHHDGFAMFDTKQSDYKITDSKTPFSSHPRSNVTKEIFSTFRGCGFKIGAYFSKPDWHSDYYWWPYFPPKDRNVNYDPDKYPDRWEKFKKFTYRQIEELMLGYGKVDVLWLDGGWVRPVASSDKQGATRISQDIGMADIAAMARRHQPGLLVVDRTVSGEFENYVTPEQSVPEKPLDIPWESCMTMGNSWSYVPDDVYKPACQIIHTLIKIVSRGGNYLLNIGPGPHGDWDSDAYDRLGAVSEWIAINGEGIYSTRSIAPYSCGNDYYYTRHKDGKISYVFCLSDEGHDGVVLPLTVSLPLPAGKPVKQVELLGVGRLKFKTTADTLEITVPNNKRTAGLDYAAAFKLIH